jgi:hypothetical protein
MLLISRNHLKTTIAAALALVGLGVGIALKDPTSLGLVMALLYGAAAFVFVRYWLGPVVLGVHQLLNLLVEGMFWFAVVWFGLFVLGLLGLGTVSAVSAISWQTWLIIVLLTLYFKRRRASY